jgi:putative molybdopterin biosynthesis protein
MKYSYLQNHELNEAVASYLTFIARNCDVLGCETIPVGESLNRITFEAVKANHSSPHYYAAAMDGIATRAAKTYNASETTPILLTLDEDYIVVDTGDPIDERFDTVVMVEDLIQQDDTHIRLLSSVAPYVNIRQIGEDICQEEILLPSNTLIRPSTMGAMLAGGVMHVKVRKRPVVGLIPTGDEVVAPKDNPLPGEVLEFNSTIFKGMLQEWGCDVITYPIVPDVIDAMEKAVMNAVSACDLVILNAGSSAGRDDYASTVLHNLGEVFLHGIAIKPGKPTLLGQVDHKPVIGVPGYPVSGILVLEYIVKHVLAQLRRLPYEENPTFEAVLSKRILSGLKYEEFIRVKLGYVAGKWIATPLNRGAGVVTSFMKADGILRIPLNTEGLEAGDIVKIERLVPMNQLENTLVSIGSHDPLIDLLNDHLRQTRPDLYLSSAHVGSMGGIMAMRRHEAHMTTIHLLDESDGTYNRSYLTKYLSDEDLVWIKGVKRTQGLMCAAGNPKHITKISDLAHPAIRYVNRQKGSGTRILLDYLLHENKIDPDTIYGYDREEFTHLSVAVQVAQDSADCGLGIYSAAKVYHLDFIPLCEEEYDFVVRGDFMDDPRMDAFLAILKSEDFARELEAMGGYKTEGIGTIIPWKGKP